MEASTSAKLTFVAPIYKRRWRWIARNFSQSTLLVVCSLIIAYLSGLKKGQQYDRERLSKVREGIPCAVITCDVLVSGKKTEEHICNLESVFTMLQERNLKVNSLRSKYHTVVMSWTGMGFPEKVEAIANAPDPKNVLELQSILGTINYHHRFL